MSETSLPPGSSVITEPKNPWLESFISQVGSLDINPRYLHIKNLIGEENFPRDERSGVLIESDKMRTLIASQLRENISKEKNFVCIFNDVDNLKHANKKVDRSFGDLLIKHGIKMVTEALDKSNLGDDVEVYLFKKGSAADETETWIFGLSDEQIDLVKKNVEQIQEPKKIYNPNFTMSTTATVISSNDDKIQKDLEITKKWFKNEEPKSYEIPYEFYQQIIDMADSVVRRGKIIKDLNRLEEGKEILEKFAEINLKTLIKTFTEDFGDSRISNELLEVLFKIVSVKTTLTQMGQRGAKALLEEISPKQKKQSSIDLTNSIINVFQDLFGKEE